MKTYPRNLIVIASLSYLSTVLAVVSSSPSWYQGCYNVKDIPRNGSVWSSGSRNLVECTRHCLLKRFNYSGLTHKEKCLCINETKDLTQVDASSCNKNCSENVPSLLSCGGRNEQHSFLSLYSSRGPYFVNSSLTVVADRIIINQTVTLDAAVYLAAFINYTKNASHSDLAKSVTFSWSIDGQPYQVEEKKAHSAYVRSRIPYTFKNAGHHKIRVTFKNALSEMAEQITEMVITPTPTRPQLCLVEVPYQQPSCIPAHQDLKGPVVAVFQGQTELFEASVSIGSNLTFTWHFSDTNVTQVQQLYSIYNTTGQPSDATSAKQGHVFQYLGVYTVSVSVENSFGKASKDLTVVVDSEELENLEFSLLPNSSRYIEVDKSVRFLVSLDTATRQDTVLVVNFGDGVVETFSLDATNTSAISDCSEPMFLLKDYGDGCQLFGEICYVYTKPGYFKPHILAKNNISSVAQPLNMQLIVHERPMKTEIVSKPFIAINTKAFFFIISPFQPNITSASWLITHEKQTILNQTGVVLLEHSFPKKGRYEITAFFKNTENTVEKVKKLIVVREPIGKVLVQALPSYLLRVGESLTFHAEVSAGNQVIFDWNIGGTVYSTQGNLTSSHSHVFHTPGHYIISVKVHNEVSNTTKFLPQEVIVQQPIEFLELLINEVLPLDTPVLLCVRVIRGLDVSLHWDFGMTWENHEIVVRNESKLCIEHRFQYLGFVNITVMALNEISNVTASSEVLIESAVSSIELQILRPPTAGIPMIFSAKTTGGYSKMSHLVYYWEFSNGINLQTACPVTEMSFSSPGYAFVIVTAFNMVNSTSLKKYLRITLRPDKQPWLKHRLNVPAKESLTLEIMGIQDTSSIQNIAVTYNSKKSENIKIEGSSISWTKSFSQVGLVEVSVDIQTNSTDTPRHHLKSLIYVDEPLTDLSIRGPTLVNILRNSTWEAIHSSGSSVVYEWRLAPKDGYHDEADIYVSSSPRFFEYLSPSGIYILSLYAENGISHQTASVTIVSVCPVVDVVLDTPYGVDNHPVEIPLEVHGGDDIMLNVTFGDGSSQHFTPEELRHLPDYLLQPYAIDPGLPLHRIVLKHLYSTPGSYHLQTTVSNNMSTVVRKTTVMVEEAITGLALVSNSSRKLSIDDTVTLRASVKTGRNISFEWRFSPPYLDKDVDSHERSSTLSVMFNVAGIEYEVWVLVFNPWMQEPLKKSMHFAPVGRIENLFLQPRAKNNSAALFQQKSGDNATNPVYFEAKSTGTNITYEFDYGDGSPVDVVVGQASQLGPFDEGTSSNIYRKEGVYTIKVTAKNFLGNMTITMAEPFYVQYPPRNVQIECDKHYKDGDSITFKGILASGTNVSFDWNFGDQNQLINAGTFVTHNYTTTGRKKVILTARNRVSAVKSSTDVFGFREISKVTLKYSGALRRVAVQESVKFTAQIIPDVPHTFKYLRWDMGDDNSKKLLTGYSIDKIYHTVGKYLVTVEAINPFSRAISAPLEVHVSSRIRSLRLLVRSSRLLNQPIKFEAYTYSGTDLKYHWDFGDGSPIQTEDIVYHTYNRSDEYILKLFVSNEISNSTVTERLFILEYVCLAPEVNILGSKNQVIQRSKDVHIEPVVSVNCSGKRLVIYTWTIYNATTQSIIKLEKINNSVFQERILFLPRRILPYGNYSIHLEVRMNDTIVYSKVEIHLQVVPSTLNGVIDGGRMRHVSRSSDEIELDGSNSEDPDCVTKDHLRYQWSCNQLPHRNVSCFRTGHKIVMNGSVLTFAGSELSTDVNDFEFSLNISVPGLHSIKTSQVLHAVKTRNILPIKLTCITCTNNIMNANEKLTLETSCDSCTGDPSLFTYEWKVYKIMNGNYNRYVHAHDYGKCVEANGSSYKLLIHSNTTMATSTATTTAATTTTTAPPTTTSRSRILSMPSRKNSSRTRSPQEVHDTNLQSVQEQVSEKKADHGRQRNTVTSVKKSIKESKSRPDVIYNPIPKTHEKHILSKSRTELPLDSNDTLSAMNGPSLVVKPGVLSQGRDYLISVNVTQKGNGTTPIFYGTAMSHFLINESPSLGSCSIRPSTGIEMQTNFSVFCYEWKDNHQPLVYEVSYNLNRNHRKNLIYRGLNTLDATLKFMLPAGNAENGDKVFVYIAVMDSLGARTSVCYIPVKVVPIDQPLASPQANISQATDRMLNATLQGYLDEKDGRNARILVNLLAIRLNRLEPMDEAAKNQRWKMRHALLCVLDHLPVRDELETLQTVQAVEAVTLKSDELTLKSANLALDILQSILNASQILYDVMGHQTENLLQLAIDSLSNIVVASSTSVDSSDFIVKSSDVANGFIKNELKFAAVEEKPIEHNSHVISIYAGRYSINYKPKLIIGQASFDLPEALKKLVDANPDLDGEDSKLSGRQKCYQAQMTSFHKRPFSLGSMETNKVQSQVTSLKLYRCDGNVIIVDHLPKEDLITIGIPLEVDMDDTIGNHTLHRTHMNIHQFNVSKLNKDQSFHILVNLTPIYSVQLFPITISISDHRPEKSSKYIYSEKFEPKQNEVKIFLPYRELKNGTYYLSIVDTTYNEGRPRPGVVTHRNYTLRLWWGQCLFWNKTDSKWSDSGCTDTSESTPEWTQCKCNHLTCFGSHYKPILNELSILDVENFIELPINPVPAVVCLFLMLLYGILSFCCKKGDLHDAKKSGIVYLQDNLATDRQKYEIVVETGFRKGAGTTAKISIILHGEYGISETRELISDEDKPLFERNSRDRFVLTLPDSIGKLLKLQLWHNNSGPSPCWYLSRVIITDVNLGQTYYFISERWFSVKEDDGRVERELWAANNKIGFETILRAKGAQYIADYHLWSSVFTKPPHSRFTRVQRLTICLTLFFTYMCLNATWYHVATKEYRGEFGLLDVSWQSIAIGILSCLTTIPLNCFLVFLFRRRLIPYPGTEEDENYEDGKSEDPELSHVTHIEPVMTYSPTPTILTLQSLQEWASRKWKKQQREPLTISSDSPLPHSENSSKPPTPTLREPATQEEKNETEEADQVSSGFEDFNSQYHRSQLSSDLLNMKQKLEMESSQSSGQSNSDMGSQEAKLLQKEKSNACSVRQCKRIFLPSWCSPLAWCLCILLCIGTEGLTIFFGIRFGHYKCIMWLQSVYFSVMTCIFITHPLCILIITAFNAYRYRMNPAIFDHYDDGYYGEKPEYRKKKQSICCEECKGFAARQRSRHLRFSRPPHRKQLLDSSKKSIQEKKSFSFFRNGTMLGLMVGMLCIMAFGKGSYSSFRLNEGLKTTLLRSGSEPFLRINSLPLWWNWVQNSFLDHIYGENYYKQPHSMEVNYIAGSSSYLIGKVHIRYVRRPRKKCAMSEHGYPHLCPKYNHTLGEETKNNTKDTNIIKLPYYRSQAAAKLMKIKEQNLINEHIQQIIIEFTLYNPPTNLFSSVSLRLNLLGTGKALPDAQISCTHLFRYITHWDKFILTCELLFVVLMLFSLKNVFVDTIHYNKKLFQHGWKVLDMSICITSILYMVCYVYRFVFVSEVIENLRSTFYQEFVDISFITVWDEILKSQLGLVLYLAIFKFLSLSRYKTLFSMLENVYKRATTEILIFAVFLLGIITAYTSLGHLAFGSFVGSFNNFWSGFLAMAALLTRNSDFTEFYNDGSVPGRLFIVAYLITGAGLFTAYILAILSSNHISYKQKRIGALSLRESLIFVWQKLLTWTGLKSENCPTAGDPSLPAEFTLAEIEYQVDELLFHMNALLGLSGMPEKPLYYLTDSDTTSDDRVGDDGISSGGSEMRGELLSDDRLEMRVQKIEENLCSKEPYLAPLIKGQTLDSELLTPEEENELRSHLELKIFCRLQMQRQGHSVACPFLEDPGIESAATSTSGSPSVDRSPSSVSNSSRRQTQSEFPNFNDIESQSDNAKSLGPASPLQANVGYGLELPILPPPGKMKLPGPLSVDRTKPFPAPLKPKTEPTEKISPKTLDLPPKPTYKCTKGKDPKLLPPFNPIAGSGFRLLRHSGESKRGLRRDNLPLQESSSGSELDAVSHGRRLPGKRNLRKTKSRGKGKGGAASLVPAGMFEQLNLEMSASDDEISNTEGLYRMVDSSILELEDITIAPMRASPITVLSGQPKEPTILEDDP